MKNPLFFTPIYQERVWGGRVLEFVFGRSLPSGKIVGESWDIVDRPEAQSIVRNGPFCGSSLRNLLEEYPIQIMGEGYDPRRPFPILIKWLDCSDRLSLQVHPPAAVAKELGGEPKTENWYIAACQPGSSLIVGLKNGTKEDEFERRLEEGSLEACVHRFPVEAGDSILVESGRLHAIDAGNLILEIQQNSDTTYRVYDWGRVGLDGNPRELHIDQSLKCIDWNDFEPSPIRDERDETVLANCKEFRLVKHRLDANSDSIPLAAGEPRLVSMIEGKLRIGADRCFKGDNLLLPACKDWLLFAQPEATFIITDRFV